ncbi:unnamed protein product [Blepharisma stoltei]|uniref:Guanylate-binding protein/Atlastin C-terminal domain-containing protein n=1 Tax=Blepharisma stoltei TaxID=1481888 RepID=A0AAU9IZK5_9CILI|nr:unnamed protein product [Blepharisma stoltei]
MEKPEDLIEYETYSDASITSNHDFQQSNISSCEESDYRDEKAILSPSQTSENLSCMDEERSTNLNEPPAPPLFLKEEKPRNQLYKCNSEKNEEENTKKSDPQNFLQILNNYFSNISCYNFRRPINSNEISNMLSNICIDQEDATLVSYIDKLKDDFSRLTSADSLYNLLVPQEVLKNLIKECIESVKKRSIPDIQSLWTSMCIYENQRVMDSANEIYDSTIMDYTSQKFPVSQKELKLIHKDAKKLALAHYFSNSIGYDTKNLLETLNEKIHEKFENLKIENEQSSKAFLSAFMNENFKVISNKMKSGTMAYMDFERELRHFQEFVRSHGPNLGCKEESLMEFCYNVTAAASESFLRQMSQELKFYRETSENSKVCVSSEMSQMKEIYNKEKEDLLKKIASFESERSNLAEREKNLHEQIKSLKGYIEKIEQGNRDLVKNIKSDAQKEIQDSLNKISEYEDKTKELERHIYQIESEKAQEIALLQQKINFLESSLEEGNIKAQKLLNELKNEKKNYNQAIKDIHVKYEEQIQSFQAKISQENEKFNDFEGTLNDKESEIEQLRLISSRNELQLSNLLKESKEEIQALKQKLDQKDLFYKKECENVQKSIDMELKHLRERLIETEAKLKEKDLQIASGVSSTQKEVAILQQKSEFLEQELLESKRVLEEERRMHETMMQTLNRVSCDLTQEEMQIEIEKIRNSYEDMLRSSEEAIEQLKEELGNEILQLKTDKRDTEMQMETIKISYENKEKDYKDAMEALNFEKQKNIEKIKLLQNEVTALSEDCEIKSKKKIKDLEGRIQELSLAHNKEISALKLENEQILNQLKKLHSDEKAIIDQRVKEEKERFEKKYSIACEEYEDRLREEQEKYEEEINALQDELQGFQESKAREIQQVRHKAALDVQKLETLEVYLQSLKDQISSMQTSHAQAIENQMIAFTNERNLLLEKIEKLVNEVSLKEREMASMEFKAETLQNKFASHEKELEDVKDQMSKERMNFIERLDCAKKTNHKLADEISQKKSEYKREIALANQHIEFQAKKIADLEKAIQENQKGGSSSKSWKMENGQDGFEMIEKLSVEKEKALKKIDMKRRTIKELQCKINKQTAIYEKEKSLLEEKVEQLTQKKQETEERYNEEIKDLREQLACRDGVVIRDKSTILKENDALKTNVSDLERKIAELLATADREKTLWENKVTFLTSQRDQARNSTIESQRKFELALEQLQKRGNRDKTDQSSILSSVEANYNHQIKELQEANQLAVNDLNIKIRSLEKDLKIIKDELDQERRLRNVDSAMLENQVQELIENEKLLKEEIEALNKQKEKEIKETCENLKHDKEILRSQVADLEQRAKDLEQQKNSIYIEYEKEKAKWALDRDHLISEKNESQDLIERLEKRKETLVREVEKLRAERGSRSRASSIARSRPSVVPNKSYFSTFNEDAASVTSDKKTEENATVCNTPSSSSNHDYSPQPLKVKNYTVKPTSPIEPKKLNNI